MPAAVVAIGSVIGGVASAVASVVGPIAATIASALGPAVAAIGSVIGAITSTIGSALAPVLQTVGGLANWVVTSVGQTVGSLVQTIATTTKPFITKLSEAIGNLVTGITETTRPILEPIKDGLQIVYDKVQTVNQWVTSAFHPSARLDELQRAYPEIWSEWAGDKDLFLNSLASRNIISSTEAVLLRLPDAIETINQIATLKVLSDLVRGQASIGELLGKISEGKGFETAQAIALLIKNIASTTVGIMDRVDTEVGVLRASIETFDERVNSSLTEMTEQTKASILADVTPKMVILGGQQIQLSQQIAKVSRHIEDEAWFAAMLLRLLR